MCQGLWAVFLKIFKKTLFANTKMSRDSIASCHPGGSVTTDRVHTALNANIAWSLSGLRPSRMTKKTDPGTGPG